MSIVCTGGGPCARTWTILTPEAGQQDLSCPKCGARYAVVDGEWQWNGEEVPGYKIREEKYGTDYVHVRPNGELVSAEFTVRHLIIPSQHGNLYAPVGHWIIAKTDGELTMCSDEYFKRFYEPAE